MEVEDRISNSVRDTEAIAAGLARSLAGGECLALYGDLGAGKTQFARGLAIGLGADPHAVSSPTFVLLNIYPGERLKLYHLDAYRVGGADDFDAIGFTELLEDPAGVVVVEWPSRVEDLLPCGAGRIDVRLEALSAHNRRISIQRGGSQSRPNQPPEPP